MLSKDLASSKQLFKEKLKEFSQCYDLHGSGLKYREEENKKKIALLQDELIVLETGSSTPNLKRFRNVFFQRLLRRKVIWKTWKSCKKS